MVKCTDYQSQKILICWRNILMLSRVWALYLEDHITIDSRKTKNQSNTLRCSYRVSQTSKRRYHKEAKEHTEWINSIIPVEIKASLRCLDPKNLNKTTSSQRLQRLLLTLAQYERGKDNIIADALSQTRVKRLCDQSHNLEKIPVHHITQIAPTQHRKTTRNICEASSKDHRLKFLAKIVH